MKLAPGGTTKRIVIEGVIEDQALFPEAIYVGRLDNRMPVDPEIAIEVVRHDEEDVGLLTPLIRGRQARLPWRGGLTV